MSISVQGHEFSDLEVESIIRRFLSTQEPRNKQSMIETIRARGNVPEDVIEAAAKRFLKIATDEGLARYDASNRTYVRTESTTNVLTLFEPEPGRVEKDISANAEEEAAKDCTSSDAEHFPTAPRTSPEPAETGPDEPVEGLSPLARFLCLLISAAAVLSVVSINGLYAASIAGTALLGAILITAMVAIDLMRPFLVGIALISFRKRLWTRFSGALTLALILAPLSVYTSFSMFSAEFSRGANARVDARQDAEVQRTYRETLDAEIARLRALSAAQWGQWQSECGNGGCGRQAGRLQDAAQATDAEIKELVARRRTANATRHREIDRAATITTSLTVFGIPERLVIQIAPLLLALGLELAAVFGPAILLVPITPERSPENSARRPWRAGRFANPNHISGEPQ